MKVRKIMIKKILIFSLFCMVGIASADDQIINEDGEDINRVDCLILEDENSIICKYLVPRSEIDKEIVVQWIDPQKDISRSRNMILPAGHGSIYDYRYIKGRILGDWTFKVIDNDKEFTTKFELKE